MNSDGEILESLFRSHQTDPLRNLCAEITPAMILDSSHNIPVIFGQSTKYRFSTTNALDEKDMMYLNNPYFPSEIGHCM